MRPMTDRPRWIVTRRRSNQPTVTHLRVWQSTERSDDQPAYVAVVTEIEGNPGLSVTNAAELIEGQLRRQLGLPFRLIEHYPANRNGGQLAETFAEVIVTRARPDADFGAVAWRPITRKQVEALIGGEL